MRILQCTISGVDSGGFAWQNVIFVSTSDDTSDVAELLGAMNSRLAEHLAPAIAAVQCSTGKILACSSKLFYPETSYTLVLPTVINGARVGTAASGALNGRITFLPETGHAVGRCYINGLLLTDLDGNLVTDDFKDALDALGAEYVALNGTHPTYEWQLVIYNRETDVHVNAVAYQASQLLTTLNKRMRA